MALPPVSVRRQMLRAYAISIGMDPDIAEQVARSEGLADDTWQSNLQQPYGREQSYGDFQLHFDPTGKRTGLGNEFVEKTGLDVSDPANWFEMNKFALDKANEVGWGPWMGAKAKGITGFMGIGGEPAEVPETFPARPTDTVAQPGAGAMPDIIPGLLDDDPMSIDDMDYAGLSKMGLKVLDKATRKKAAAEIKPPEPMVLQPLQRYTLKGLL